MTKNKEYTHIDFDNFTRIEFGYLLIPRPDEKYQALPDVYNRVCNVIYFASKIGCEPDRACANQKSLNEAFIRAALCEFFSIEDYILKSYPECDEGIWFHSSKNSNPILHVLKNLRNYNIHVDSSKVSTKPIQVKTLVHGDKELEVGVEFISNLSVEELRRTDSTKKYSSNDLKKMIEVFEEQQHIYGIAALIMKCALDNLNNLDVLLKKE